MMIEPAELSNQDFQNGNPTESRIGGRGASVTINDANERVLNRGLNSGPSLPRVGQSQPQTQVTALAAPVTNVVSSFQTTEFLDDDPGELLTFKEAGTNGVYEPIATNIDLGNFLRRPVAINSFSWTSSWTDVTFSPWYNYLMTPEIVDKLQNFPFIRGKLKLKFVINSSPFYYGAMRAHYYPMAGYHPARVSSAATAGSKFIPYSQFPGIFIYPQTSTGGEMELPFFYHRDYLPLKTANELNNMGKMYMTEFVDLRSANGAVTNGVTITLYAWMEDVQLAAFTSSPILQGDEYDEATGPISRPAAILSNWASYLESVPIIGRLATATKIGSGAVSSIATLFGWTNVPVVTSVMPFKNLPFHDLASAEISQPVSKFTLDPKAEVSVSPFVVGLDGDDELAVAAIVQRDSYLAQFTWATTDAPNTQFFCTRVNPLMYDRGTVDAFGTYAINITPLCAVARMFRYWRGDLIYTFRIVASKFHRGRLRLHWEPYASPAGVANPSHVTMTKVVDIEDTTDVEFRIPYMQPVPWAEHQHQGDLYTTNKWVVNSPSVLGPNTDDDNGTIMVRCLNNLSAPVDTAPISVMIFVRGAENVQFANPIDVTKRFSHMVPQSDDGIEYKTGVDPGLYLKNWGEPILSLRKLLRRSNLVDIRRVFGGNTSALLYEARLPMTKYPPQCGFNSSAFTTAKALTGGGGTYGYNYVQMTHFAWIAPCFLALRGSMRWHLNLINFADHGPDSVAVYRDPGVTIVAPSFVDLVPGTSNTENLFLNSQFNNIVNTGTSGIALTNYEGQPGLSCEMPFMIPYKFFINNYENWLLGQAADKSNADSYKIILRGNDLALSQEMRMERYCSIGTDFNAHFFLCVPTVYYNPNSGVLPS
jgi:hypothetical protein